MKVHFHAAGGVALTWDGVLWSSSDARLAAALNEEVLPPPDSHGGILGQAGRLLGRCGYAQVETHVEDDTGWPEEHIGEDCFFVEEGVAGEGMAAQSPGHDSPAETRNERRPASAAQGDSGGGVCPGGPDAGDAGEHLDEIIEFLTGVRSECEDEWSLAEVEWAALKRWALEKGLIVDVPGPVRDEPEISREHGTRFEEAGLLWWKFTRPNAAGYFVDWSEEGKPFVCNASPLDYFLRLRRQNRLFSDAIVFRGLWARDTRIVITQPHVAGPEADMEQIGGGNDGAGFSPSALGRHRLPDIAGLAHRAYVRLGRASGECGAHGKRAGGASGCDHHTIAGRLAAGSFSRMKIKTLKTYQEQAVDQRHGALAVCQRRV